MPRPISCLALLLAAGAASAQTHTIAKKESVVRAVGVYEWTGEEGKATASRFVPVSIYINGGLQDAGIYLARPTPFALLTGTVFQVRKAGEDEGTLELAYARHVVGAGSGSYDDGWMGVGSFKIKPKEVFQATAKKSGPLPQIQVSGGKGPKLNDKSDKTADAAAKPVDRSGAAGSGTTVSAQDDPDRPTMRRKTDTDSTASTDTSDDSKDVDRPTLRRRTPEQTKAKSKAKQQASVSSAGDLNDDPDRPSLHRGKPVTRMEEDDLPPLKGIPADMHQRVAVSDAKDRPEHDFARAWDSEAQRVEVLAAMRQLAQQQLAGYGGVAARPAAVKPARKVAGKAAAARAAGPAAELRDEDLRAYTLSYGGAATYEFQASSPGVDGVVRYVTVVAQRDPLGALQVALAKVTDAQHLDRTPWFRLVDVVDVEASNRASMLFELRGQTTRQFAVYRVIGAQADQLFVTYSAQ